MTRFEMILCVTVILALVYEMGYTQENKSIEFQLLSQEDDLSLIIKKKDKSTYESFKWIDLKKDNALSFGGAYRFQAESYINENFTDQGNQDNIWFLNRVMLHALLKLGDKFVFFGELNSSTVINKIDVSPVDEDLISVNQAFIKYAFHPNWNFIFGRENVMFGARRLVDIREGPNVRRSFDVMRLNYKNTNTNASAFFSVPVQPKSGIFDNQYLNSDELFTGFYLTKNWNTSFNFDVYGFYQKDDNVTYNVGTANERRYSVGLRFFGALNNISYNNEAVYQFGSFGNQDIQSYTISVQGEYAFMLRANKVRLGLKTEVISGDKKSNDRKLNTFDALYPRGAYFGRVAKFGPSNLIDMHPYLNINKSNYYFELDYDAFWRFSVTDGVYGASLLLDYPSTNNKRFIGHQLGALVGCNVNNHLNIEFETNIIVPGSFLKNSGLSSTLCHAVMTTEFKF